MSRYLSRLRHRRGQGMTEYIIAVGLIAILLTVVVERFKNQIYVTIVGNENSPGMTGAVNNDITSQIGGNGAGAGGGGGKKPKPGTTGGATAPGN
jgi:hypothetical protein